MHRFILEAIIIRTSQLFIKQRIVVLEFWLNRRRDRRPDRKPDERPDKRNADKRLYEGQDKKFSKKIPNEIREVVEEAKAN